MSQVEIIASLFQDELRLKDVSCFDNFFDLGGDSMMAESLIIALNAHFGTILPTSTLLEAPTPDSLAKKIALMSNRKDFARLVTTLTDCTGKVPAAMVHGMSGSPLFVSRFGGGFKQRCQIAAVRGMGLVPGENPLTTADEIADAYMTGLQTSIGRQPEVFGGICLGGLVALDLARRQFQSTRKRPIIILIDPPPPGSAWLKPMQNNEMTKRRTKQLHRQVIRWRRLRDRLDRLGLSGSVLGRKARRETFKKSLKRALAGHTPKPFPSEILMIASTDWGRTTVEQYRSWAQPTSSITIEVIPGEHGGFQTANATLIDEIISGFLDKNLPSQATT